MVKNRKLNKVLSKSPLKLNLVENFFITNFTVSKIYNDEPIGFHCLFSPNLHESQKKIFNGNFLNPEVTISKSGSFLQKDGSEIIFQLIFNTFFKQASVIKILPSSLINENVILGYELLKKNQSKDIVQGLPKIESLIEAYSPKNAVKLMARSGISFGTNVFQSKNETITNMNFESMFTNAFIVSYGNRFYKLKPIPFGFKPTRLVLGLKYSDLENDKRAWAQEAVYSAATYEFTDLKKQRQFFSDAKLPLNKKIGKYSKKKFKDKYFPQKSSFFWIYKLENFVSFKWLKVKPIFWKTGFFSFQIDQPFFISSENYVKWVKRGKLVDYLNNDLIVQTDKGKYYYLEFLPCFSTSSAYYTSNFFSKNLGLKLFTTNKRTKNNFLNFIYFGENNAQKILNIQNLLLSLYTYHSLLDGSYTGLFKALLKFQLLLGLSIDDSYKSQGINLSPKHIEIVVKQMTDKGIVEDPKDTNLLPLELIKLVTYKTICESLISFNEQKTYHFKKLKKVKKTDFFNYPLVKPKLFSATNSVFSKEGFLSQAGFQNTKKVLTKAAIEGPLDWLTNLKQQIICGQPIAAGSAFLNFKYNLDKIYLFKKKN